MTAEASSLVSTVPRCAATVHADLSQTYDLDMGRRTEDIPFVAELVAGIGSMCEVGAGTGRIPLALHRLGVLPPRWVGIEPSESMIERATEHLGSIPSAAWRLVHGDARSAAAWCRALDTGTEVQPFDLVLIPFSTLFLIPHDEQVQALRLARTALAPGGRCAFEVFVPRAEMTESGTFQRSVPCCDPRGARGWARRTTYRVDAGSRTTRVRREYGPAGASGGLSEVGAAMVVEETIHWRAPEELPDLMTAAGFYSPEVRAAPLAPAGNVFVLARR